MAENAKSGAAKDANSTSAKKGRASKDIDEVKTEDVSEAEVVETSQEKSMTENEAAGEAKEDGTSAAGSVDLVGSAGGKPESAAKSQKSRKARKTVAKSARVSTKTSTKGVGDAKADDVMIEEFSREEFQEEIRVQIENCKNELKVSLEQSIKEEFSAIVKKQLRSANRRRRVGAIARDIIILLLAAAVGYLGWCLYDVRYFDWMGPRDVISSTEQPDQKVDEPDEVVKDKRWYINNYGYLFEDLQLGLNADNVETYYLYSDDRKVSEIKPTYLLGMAYNKVMPTSESSTTADGNATVAAADLRAAFEGMFGTTEYFEKVGFTHGCKKFTYVRESDSFVTENGDCAVEGDREIVEEIDEMYEEGSVLYVLTTAAIYDEGEASFYSFDNLFKPAATNAAKSDLAKNRAVLNRYQYQFKKTGEKYHFSGVVKLQ